jgi:hypothetical protein
MKLSHRLGLVAGLSLVTVAAGAGANAAGAAGPSSHGLTARVIAVAASDSDGATDPIPAPADAPECEQIDASELPALPIEGEAGVVVGGATGVVVDGSGDVAAATELPVDGSGTITVEAGDVGDGIVVSADLPPELVDAINADTDALVAHLAEAGFTVEVTTDDQGVRTPQLDVDDEALMAAVESYYTAEFGADGDGIAVAVDAGSIDAGSIDDGGLVVSCMAVAAEPANP